MSHPDNSHMCQASRTHTHTHPHTHAYHLKCYSSAFGQHLGCSWQSPPTAASVAAPASFFFFFAGFVIVIAHNDWACYRLSVALFRLQLQNLLYSLSISVCVLRFRLVAVAYVLLASWAGNSFLASFSAAFLSFSIKANCVACFAWVIHFIHSLFLSPWHSIPFFLLLSLLFVLLSCTLHKSSCC